MNCGVPARRARSLFAALLLAGLATSAAWAAPRSLAIHDLGTFEGVDTFGGALNDRGQIVGGALFGPGDVRSFLWDSGTMIDLGPGLYAADINDRGQILLQGFIGELDEPNSCFLRNGEALIDLGTPVGTQCHVSDLNNRGQVVGTMGGRDGVFFTSHAFLWDSGTITDLGWLGGDWAIALAINDRGQVVGGSTDPRSGYEHAFLWEAGRMTDLSPPGTSWSRACAINNRGQVVVQSGTHTYLWEAGSLTDLGTMGGSPTDPGQISWPLDMNERGQLLVAVYDPPGRVFRYGIWESGTITPLPTLGSGVPTAAHLNNRGQVVGADRTDAGEISHLVLWTPVASPGRGGP